MVIGVTYSCPLPLCISSVCSKHLAMLWLPISGGSGPAGILSGWGSCTFPWLEHQAPFLVCLLRGTGTPKWSAGRPNFRVSGVTTCLRRDVLLPLVEQAAHILPQVTRQCGLPHSHPEAGASGLWKQAGEAGVLLYCKGGECHWRSWSKLRLKLIFTDSVTTGCRY